MRFTVIYQQKRAHISALWEKGRRMEGRKGERKGLGH